MINRFTLCCWVVLIGAGCEETTTEVTPPVARDAFALALEAHGGEAKIALVAPYTIEATGDCYEPEQTFRPGGQPIHGGSYKKKTYADPASGRSRIEWQIDGLVPFEDQLLYAEVLASSEGSVMGRDAWFAFTDAHALEPATIGARKALEQLSSPIALLRASLADRGAIARRAERESGDKKYDVIALPGEEPRVELLIDQTTNLVARAEVLQLDSARGDVVVSVRYDDYRSAGDVREPFELTWAAGNHVIFTEKRSIVPNATIDETLFALGETEEANAEHERFGVHYAQQIQRGRFSGFPLEYAAAFNIEVTELAPGVALITGGSHHSLAVELDDQIVLIEAPLFEERSNVVLAELSRRFPGKNVGTVISTHFHPDHSGGLRTYAARGATIIAGAASMPALETLFAARFSVRPDSFEVSQREAVLEAVTDRRTIGRVEVYVVENSHADGMLIAYLPAEKILFSSDLFTPAPYMEPLTGAAKTWAGELLAAITTLGLDVQTISGGHGFGTASMETLRFAAGELPPPTCVKCSALFGGSGGVDPTSLCAESAPLYDAMIACTCGPSGACTAACGATACTNAPPSSDCFSCLMSGCGPEVGACAGDN